MSIVERLWHIQKSHSQILASGRVLGGGVFYGRGITVKALTCGRVLGGGGCMGEVNLRRHWPMGGSYGEAFCMGEGTL